MKLNMSYNADKTRILRRTIQICFLALMFFVITAVLIKSNAAPIKYYYAVLKCKLPHYLLILSGLCMLFACYMIFHLVFKKSRYDLSVQRRNVLIFGVFLFLFQLFLIKNYYFETDWDVGVLLETARSMAHGKGFINQWYFSECPNNIFLTEIFALILSVTNFLHLGSGDFFVIIVFQCLLNLVSLWMFYQICFHVFQNRELSAFAIFAYSILISLSPWLSIPYSDVFGIVFPVAVLWLYVCDILQKSQTVKWFLIAFIAVLGFKIKPQTIFVPLSIITFVSFKSLLSYDFFNNVKIYSKKVLFLLLGLIFGVSLTTFSTRIYQKNSENVLGLAHYLMLGMNSESYGRFTDEDLTFARQFPTNNERSKAEFAEATARIKNMGIYGISKHISNKATLTFYDGTFTWGNEGEFYKTIFPSNNTNISNFVRNLYYNRDFKGKYFDYWSTIITAYWLGILFFTLISVFCNDRKYLFVVMMSVVLLICFQLVFETRGRYLICNLPLFILLSAAGINYSFNKILLFLSKFKSQHNE